MNNIDASEKRVIHLKKSNTAAGVYDWVQSMLFAIAIVILLLTFALRLVSVDGGSMNNTLFHKDKVIVTNFLYTPKTGDIVVISHGEHYADPIIKRVIATEGQTLEIDEENNTVTVDGIVLDEPYAVGNTYLSDNNIPEVIPEGKVFVMGDNREDSLDSRSTAIGLVNESDIIGKAQYVVYPFSSFQNLG